MSVDSLLKEICSLNVLEVSTLVKRLEDELGISSAMPIATVASAPSEVKAEKTLFTIVLKNPGDSKINVIKEVRSLTGLGLKEAKDFVSEASDANPKVLKADIKKDEFDKIATTLQATGATIGEA